jgi:hypothetical protein
LTTNGSSIIELPGKAISLGTPQPKRNVDRAGSDLIRLLENLSQGRGGVMDLHLDAPFRLYLDLLSPGFRHVDLEEAGRSQEMAELESYVLGPPADSLQRQRHCHCQHRTASRSMSSSRYCVPLIDAGMAA